MKACLVFGILLALGLPAGAQQVAEEELRSAGQEIEFENYSGPYERVDTAEEIKAIGFLLAGSLQQDGNAGRFLDKYRILRALDPREQGKFDADILSIEAAARVDHIENVRRILAGYLEGAFAYNASDARLLARFATVYNAVYRGNLGYFGQKYKAVVMSHLTPQNAGISTRYYEWPGATRLLVPLATGAAEGRLGSLSTTELTEKEVIEELRRQPDQGLEERKDMVELKEREIEEKQAEVQEAQKDLAGEKAELEQKQAELAAATTPEEKARAQEEVARQEEEVKRAEAAVAEKQAEVAAKEAEVAEERGGIIADEKARETAGAGTGAAAAGAFALADQLYFLKVRPRERLRLDQRHPVDPGPRPSQREAHLAGGLRAGPGLPLLQGFPAGGGPGRIGRRCGAPAAAQSPHPGAGEALLRRGVRGELRADPGRGDLRGAEERQRVPAGALRREPQAGRLQLRGRGPGFQPFPVRRPGVRELRRAGHPGLGRPGPEPEGGGAVGAPRVQRAFRRSQSPPGPGHPHPSLMATTAENLHFFFAGYRICPKNRIDSLQKFSAQP